MRHNALSGENGRDEYPPPGARYAHCGFDWSIFSHFEDALLQRDNHANG